jgi:hypothetical protein
MSGHGGGGENPIVVYTKWWWRHLTSIHEFTHYFSEYGISRALLMSILFWGEFWILSLQIPNLFTFTLAWLFGTLPVWMPIALYVGALRVWIWYVQSLFIASRKPILLEVKMPREITRSPRAMELAFTAFSISSGETTFITRAWQGKVRPFFSFEIASFGGELHFYVWCWSDYKAVVESALYAQYPEVEIYEVEDYASRFRYNPSKQKVWGVEWPLMTYVNDGNGKKISMSDFKINAYPFRTYVDFELDKDPKEEFKVDPLANVLEFMSSINPNEQLWIQFVIRKCGKKNIFLSYDEDDKWKDTVEKEVQKLRAQAAVISSEVLHEAGLDEESHPPSARPSWKHQQMMMSMERNLGKYPFEVGARGIYWVEGALRGPMTTGFRWIWRPLGNPFYGTHLRPRKWHCDFDYPWQDFRDIRWTLMGRRVLDAYRRRMFFHSPWDMPTNVLTNEELATVWHPPSRAVSAPGLQRIGATKSEPPPNLPM